MRWLPIALIYCYRLLLSPILPRCCRYTPTCSGYALDAFRIHGLFKGALLAGWRVLRCHPWSAHGYDPVPPKGAWKHPDRYVQRG